MSKVSLKYDHELFALSAINSASVKSVCKFRIVVNVLSSDLFVYSNYLRVSSLVDHSGFCLWNVLIYLM